MTDKNTDQKATACQKTPTLENGATLGELLHKPDEAEITRQAGLQAAKTHKWNGWDWKAYQTSITRQNHHISKTEAHADKLAEALRDCRTDNGATAFVHPKYAPQRLRAINEIVTAALAAYESGAAQ